MGEWLVHNWVVIAGVAVGVISTWTLVGSDIRQLKKDRDEDRKKYEVCDSESKRAIEALEKELKLHTQDSARHIDQYRDEKRFDEFKGELIRRFDGIETRFDTSDRKLERLMISVPPH